MAKKKKKQQIQWPDNCIRISSSPQELVIHASKNNLTYLDLFDECGNLHYAGTIQTKSTSNAIVQYTIDCPADQIKYLIRKHYLRGGKNSGYELYAKFRIKKQATISPPGREKELFERTLQTQNNDTGLHLMVKLTAQRKFLDKQYAKAEAKQKSRAKRRNGRVVGGPRGFGANADHISGAIPNLPPLEGGLCCPK